MPPRAALVGVVLVAGALVGGVLLAACAPAGGDGGPGGDRPVVLASTTVFADLVADVGGTAVDVRALVPVGGDPHVFEPRPSDAVAVATADLVVDGGLGLSPWLPPLLRAREGPVLDLGEAVGDAARRADGSVDPHVWMVPATVARAYLPAIERALADLVPAEVAAFAARADALATDLADLDAELRAVLSAIPPDRRLLVTSHDAHSWFADAYDLEVVGTVIGVSTEEEPSARTVAALIDAVVARGVPAVFIETTVNPDVLRRIAADAGVAVGEPLYGDSLGPPGSGAETYADMLRTNARHLAEGLGEGS